MATSFAEAFKLARAAKGDAGPISSPVSVDSALPTAQPNFTGQALLAQEAAMGKRIASQNYEKMIIDGLSTATAPAPLAVHEALIPATTPVDSAARSPKKTKKAGNVNLEEYYERAALVKAVQRDAKPVSRSTHPSYELRSPKLAQSPSVGDDSVILTVAPGAQLIWDGRSLLTTPLSRYDPKLGMRTQLSSELKSAREVVLGIDFGTSSAKVVIGDRDLKKAHAVPFRDVVGIDAYLLPARLYDATGSYSLHAGTRSFDDLKLALLASPDNEEIQCRVAAFLGLAIREARAWLFAVHAEDYSKTQIVWTLSLGLPAENILGKDLTDMFKRLGAAAWSLAGGPLTICRSTCAKALANAQADTPGGEIVVTVTPEIAAQVYGFVNSRSFDDNARNFFLIADVGAGTVDTCLFRVVRAKGGRWSFEICTTAVEPAGVMNLHRHRVAWWQQHLALAADSAGIGLCKQLESIKLATENQASIPASYDEYLSGVSVRFTGKEVDPDKAFFAVPLLRQVRGHTLYRAFKNNLLGKQDLVSIPFFLCGGGTRLSFYQNLTKELSQCEGFSWLRTRSQDLVMPDNLRAFGVRRSDYDRLSVAYGLSMLDLSGLTTMPQLPSMTDPSSHEQWRSHYVDKDHC